ncbi:MAG: protein kinase [Pyrinomonadaceae bacterium]
MKNGGWEKVKGIFADAIRLAPEKRLQYLQEVCGDDTDTQREVEKLLASFVKDELMERPPANEVDNITIKADAKHLEAGKRFGHYEIIKQIGAGGMGEVYLAEDQKLDRKVAVKILNEKFSQHQSNLQRFVQEAKAASGLNHPNILVIHEIGESEEANYIVSEFVEGETLREIIDLSSMTLSEVLDVSIQITSALVAAHAARIVHRDIKPENIIVRPDGFVKILDFGLAKLVEKKAIGFEASTVRQNQTAKGVILGTVNYMSPEQAKGERVDEQTDIFSLGVVVYEMIAGKTPFAGDSMSETFANLINAEPLPLARFAANVSDETQRIVSKTLRKKKDDRYQTMKDLLSDLKDLRENLAFDSRLEKSHSGRDGRANTVLARATGNANQADQTRDNLTQQIKGHKSLSKLVLVFLLVVATGLGYYFVAGNKSATNVNGEKSIAILPFVNASQDPNAEYLSDGITESVINNLSQLTGLKVMSKNSAFRFKNDQTDVRNIASQLGVEALVTGDIRQIGERLVINVRLINPVDESQIWGKQYVKTSSDIIITQNEIARDVSRNLGVRLSSAEEQKLSRKTTDSPEAYELYLRGEYLLAKSKPSDAQKAIEYFQRAIDLDPNFARAYLGLSSAHAYLTRFPDIPQQGLREKVREYTLKAASLDEQLPEAHEALAGMSLRQYKFADAEREYKRAIELNPNYAGAHLAYGYLLTILERHEESLAEVRRGLELDPAAMSNFSVLGTNLFYARRYDEAIEQFKKVLELEPDFLAHYGLAISYEMKGDYAASIAERIKMNELGGTPESAAAVQKSFDRGGWQGFLREATDDNPPFIIPPYIAATFNAELGEKNKAFAILEKLYEKRSLELTTIKVDPRLDNLRDDSRFQDLVRRVGLPE